MLRSWFSMEELLQTHGGELRRVVLRRPVELTSRKRPFAALPRNDAMGQQRPHALQQIRGEKAVLSAATSAGYFGSELTCCSTTTGSVSENVEPWPSWDSTQILPPCISTMRFDMASPKPVPPFLRVIALSAC